MVRCDARCACLTQEKSAIANAGSHRPQMDTRQTDDAPTNSLAVQNIAIHPSVEVHVLVEVAHVRPATEFWKATATASDPVCSTSRRCS